ncbi:MAG: thiaminase II [Candidatus Carbobacillus sp.]|nr:thiaminase II [Candidatus Carbobacillus sp.]
MRFSEKAREATRHSWSLSHRHPFVQGIIDGTLPKEKFRFYILQDIFYLKDFAKVHALAATQTNDFRITAMLAEKAKFTAEAEIGVHKEHAELLGLSHDDIENVRPAPTTYAYTSHMLRAAMSGRLSESIAALLPCYWLYADIGYQNRDKKPTEPMYQNWLNTYASDWFQTSTQEMIDLFDALAEEATEKERQTMLEHFVIMSEWELAFWEMAYTEEKWPSEVYGFF